MAAGSGSGRRMANGGRRSRSVGRRAAPRRKRVWARDIRTPAGVGNVIVPAAPGSVSIDLLANFTTQYGADPIGVTVTRLISDISSSGTPFDFAVGVVKTAIADTFDTIDPVDREHADWMFWAPVYSGSLPANTFHIDNRSMRKLDELGENLLMSFAALGTAGGNLKVVTSTLLLLP